MINNICTACGTGVSESEKFCTTCGVPVQRSDVEKGSIPSEQIAPPPPAMQQAIQPQQQTIQPQKQAYQPQQQPSVKPITEADFIPSNKSKYEPISTRGYLGIWLLMIIPIINLLMLIVWACGGCRKISKRNFARAMFIVWIIAIILGVILTIVFKGTFDKYISPIIAPYSFY